MNSKTIPCPMCGSENEVGAAYCTVCGYHLQQQSSNAGGHKCARCGSRVPQGYDFCPVCGLDQRHRFARPATQVVNVSESSPSQAPYTPAGEGYQMPPAPAAAPAPGGADRTVPAPGLLQGGGYSPQGPAAGGMAVPSVPQPDVPPPAAYPPPATPAYGQPQYGQPAPYGPPAQPGPYAPSGGTDPALAPSVPGPPPAVSPPQTGRTQFHDGPPLARPPRVQDEDLTVPVPSRRPTPPPPPRPAAEAPPGPPGSPVPADPGAAVGRDPLDEQPPTLPGHPDRPSVGTLPGGPPQASPPQGAWQPSVPTIGEPRPPSMVEAPAFEDAVTGVDTPSATAGVTVRLVLVGRDGEEGESFPMTGDAIAVGREHGEILFPDDAFMSPQHARVERSGDVFTLVDLGSANGVYLKIRGNSAVYPGDLFMVGHQVLRLENVVEPVQEQPPGPDGTRSFGTPLKPAWGKLALVGRGGVAGDTYFLRGAKVIFGREQGDILFPHDPFVSREHARLRLELHGAQMAVFLEDLGSANGTYIRIRGSAEVRGRDTFRIGDQILRLRLDR